MVKLSVDLKTKHEKDYKNLYVDKLLPNTFEKGLKNVVKQLQWVSVRRKQVGQDERGEI